MNTTLYDLKKTATAAAEKAIDGSNDPLAQDSIALAEFEAAGHDRLDYPQWREFFNSAVSDLTNLKSRPSAATIAAKAKPLEA